MITNFDVSRITGMTADSRKVEDGFLFVAVPGVKVDGRAFIPEAVAKGAAFIAVAKGTEKMIINGSRKLSNCAANTK